MFITRLYLKGYLRLKPSGIDEIDLNFTSIQQVIIGTNGSGKSSILAEASPYPAQSRNYEEGGEKHIELSHHGKQYVCINKFEKKTSSHYFSVDGEVLNAWGTSKIQQQLVKTHFGLDASLLALLMGKENFSDYPALKRRQLLMDISGSDFDYAMKVFNSLKERSKAQHTITKHEASRVAAHQQKLSDLGDVQPKEREIAALVKDIERCYALSPKQLTHTYAEVVDQHKTYPERIHHLGGWVTQHYPYPPKEWGTTQPSVDGIKERLSQYEHQLKTTQEALEKAYERRADLVEILANSDKAGQLDALTHAKEHLNRKLEEAQRSLGGEPKNVEAAFHSFEQIYPKLLKSLEALPDNRNHELNADKYEQAVKKGTALKHKLNEAFKRQAQLQTELKHLTAQCVVQCPHCRQSFIPGVSTTDLPKLTQEANIAETHIQQLEEALERVEDYQRRYQVFHDQKMKLCASMQGNPMHSVLWERLEPLLGECQDTLLFSAVEAYRQRLVLEQHHYAIEAQYAVVYRDWEFAQAMASKDFSLSQDQNLQLDQHISFLLTEQDRLIGERQTLRQYGNDLSHWLSQYDLLMTTIQQAFENAQEGVDHLFRQTLEDHRLNLQLVVSQHQRDLHDLRMVTNAIQEAQTQLDLAHTRQSIYSNLTKAISPNEGLISEHIRGFLSTFVDQINRIIAAVWTYDFRVLPCGLDSDELDYKFPLSIESDDPTSTDLSECSSSQLDMLNFAIRLTVMHFLGLQDYPLYLDELAATMDEQHRINMFAFVHSLVESGNCSQLFMISHYVAGHGGMANAEVLVVSDTNIINMPGVYNRHARIKRSKT